MSERQTSSSQDTGKHSDTPIAERYQRARAFMQGLGSQQLVQNDTIFPVWIEGSECFWYERFYKKSQDTVKKAPTSENPHTDKQVSKSIAKQYRLVDAQAATHQPAFDHSALASALSATTDQPVDSEDLPITLVDIQLNPLRVCFTAFEQRWQFNAGENTCEAITPEILPVTEVRSPDGQQIAFNRDYNLWLRDTVTGEERPLTQDGEEEYNYFAATSVWGSIWRRLTTPAVQWSPDSTRLLAVKRDTRLVKTLPVVDHVPADGSLRPQLMQAKVAYPGDEQIETWQAVTIEVATGKVQLAEYPPLAAGLADYENIFDNLLWWAADSRRAYFIDQQRGDRVVRLVELDTDSGATRLLFEETSDTHINILPDLATLPLHRILVQSNELVWWSQRSDWGHLYLYDLTTGACKHAITSGDWCVRDVLHIDPQRRELWLQTAGRTPGRDPYYQDICRVNIDTGELITVCAADEEIEVHCHHDDHCRKATMPVRSCRPVNGVSPSGDYVVATRSRADQVPVTELLDRAGKTLLTVETADISGLPSDWHWPEPVQVEAADGETALYGLLFRPSNFSADKRYPVLNYMDSMPQVASVSKGSFHNGPGVYSRRYFYASALAELGFIVWVMDSRGTPLRSKSFQDHSYGWIASSADKADHLGALEQLTDRYPFMDRERMGIFGFGYRSSLEHFLACQSVYKVCVQMGVMDNRLIGAFEQDGFEGLESSNNHHSYPEALVSELQGKLLLMHHMDGAAYPAAAALRIVDALQKANKDFDMLIVPRIDAHAADYMLRRAWDYLVEHLLRST